MKHTFLGNEYITLARKWGVFKKQKKDYDNREVRQRRSKFVDTNDEGELKEYLIIPFKWQVPVIIFQCHTGPGSHLKVKPTCDVIIKEGYKWKTVERYVREFIYKCQICQMCTGKLRKGTIVSHINSSKSLERFQIDLVTLASLIASKKHKHFLLWLITFQNSDW